MCGFVGFLLPESISYPDLAAWSDKIRHRGPDQGGQATHAGFGVGARRLAIQDLSPGGNQPMQNDRYILAFNGEVFNHLELRNELRVSGVSDFKSHSDTETVLLAIQCWGLLETLNRLNGMYALAVWDKQRKELAIARDPLGVKPICYINADGVTYFASEIKALLSLASRKISSEGLALYLHFGFVPAPYSLVEGIRKVRPGEVLVFNQAGIQSYSIEPRAWTQLEPLHEDPAERVHQVRKAVEAAVRRQLLSDVPVGLFLSGGVDSSVIAASASICQSGLKSFSLRPDSIQSDPGARLDAEIASRFAKTLGLTHHEIPLQPESYLQDIDTYIQLLDEPVAELYAIGEIALSRKARAEGVPVVLTGHGGDEVFLGYPTYSAVFRGDLYNHIPLLGKAFQLASEAPWLSRSSQENLQGAANLWRKPPLERYMIVSAVHFSPQEVATLSGLASDQVARLVQQVVTSVQENACHLPRHSSLRNAEMFARMDMLLMVPEHYNMRLDRASMSASVEARVPLQDLELIGLVSQLSYKDLMRGGLKGLFKQAFADVLPAEVINRPKQTFQAPMLSWISGPLKPWIKEQYAQLPEGMSRLLPTMNGSISSTRHAYQIWLLALLEGWRKAYTLEY